MARSRLPFRHQAEVTWCLDEIQLIPGWERFVRRVLDAEKVELFLSGSSARMLSREVATSMRGRAMETVITPFSFRKFLRGRNWPDGLPHLLPSGAERSALRAHFDAYLDVIRAVSSINADWDSQDMWDKWGRTQIEKAPLIKERWLGRMAEDRYVNADANPFKLIGFTTPKAGTKE